MDCSTPGLPVHHQLPEFTQTHAHWVSDAVQSSHPLSSPSPPTFNLSEHHGLLQWVGSSHQVVQVLECIGSPFLHILTSARLLLLTVVPLTALTVALSALPWWVVMLSISLHVCCPSICLIWENLHSSPLSILINAFIVGCAGSSLLSMGFLYLWRVGSWSSIGAGASHYSGLSSCRAQALGIQASVVVGHRLSSFSGQAW